MTSQITRGCLGRASVKANTIEFSITEQLGLNGETPPMLVVRPRSAAARANTASMCGVAPGSTSVTVISKRDQISFMQATVAAQSAALAFQPGTCVARDTIVDVFACELLVPGVSVTPRRLR